MLVRFRLEMLKVLLLLPLCAAAVAAADAVRDCTMYCVTATCVYVSFVADRTASPAPLNLREAKQRDSDGSGEQVCQASTTHRGRCIAFTVRQLHPELTTLASWPWIAGHPDTTIDAAADAAAHAFALPQGATHALPPLPSMYQAG